MVRNPERSRHYVVKASGEKELFSHEKLKRSLMAAGTDEELAERIIDSVHDELAGSTSTRRIYNRAFAILKKKHKAVAARYSLRQAVMGLGPTGFPFEMFFGEILKQRGYAVQVGIVMQGRCADHEIDILAKKENAHIMVESKFHNSPGFKTDLKIALYVQARFDDLMKKRKHRGISGKTRTHEAWLVTNTKFTSKAIAYAECTGLKLVGWNYHAQGNLRDLILEHAAQPLTSLSTLSRGNQKKLFEKGIVMCRDIPKKKHVLKEIGITGRKADTVIKEIGIICAP